MGVSVERVSSDTLIPSGGLSQGEAEDWIREADYKGNGVIDFDAFMDALMGKPLWTPLDDEGDLPTIKIFQDADNTRDGRVRAMTLDNSFQLPRKRSLRIRHGLAEAMIDSRSSETRGSRSSSFPCDHIATVGVRSLACEVDQHYFAA